MQVAGRRPAPHGGLDAPAVVFDDALDPDEANAPALIRAPDPGGDVLPFGHLEYRRFEILVYRLKYVELNTGMLETMTEVGQGATIAAVVNR